MGPENSGQQGRSVAPIGVDYYAVLSRAIEASKDNPGQVRSAIYDLARVNLHREILWQNPAITDAELRLHLLALEDAIERIEATHADGFDNRIFQPDQPRHFLDAPPGAEPEPEPSSESAGQVVILAPQPPMAMQNGPMLQTAPDIIVDYHPPSREFARPHEPPGRVMSGIGAFVQLTAAALLAVAIFAVMTGQLDIRWLHKKQQAATEQAAVAEAPKLATSGVAAREAAMPAAAAPPPFPLPATYGVYAVSNDKLIELDKLSLRVPDARVLISPDIREPSRTTLPDGKIAFVVFRRELVNGAPEKVSVRVVAKIAREMTFTDGKASTNNVENLWRIRNNAFDFKVAPLTDSRDMIVIKPDADFVFPAGRYALVLNGQGYDFTVAGPITSSLQCLERIETVNGAMYSECRNPQVH